MAEQKNLEETLLELEKRLLEPEVRTSSCEVSRLLSGDFLEFYSSGRIYEYQTGDVFSAKAALTEIRNFRVRELSESFALATYRAISEGNSTLRSSIWKLESGNWKVLFHQGTPSANASPGC